MQANSSVWRLALVLSLAGAGTGCRSISPKSGDPAAADASSPTNPAPTTLPVGTVELVDEAGKFVLIRSSRQFQIEPGTVLTVHGDQGEPVASLTVSPARKGSFLTADIVSGTPRKGLPTTMQYVRPDREATADPFSGTDDPNAIQVLE